jgi:hypothetical protein
MSELELLEKQLALIDETIAKEQQKRTYRPWMSELYKIKRTVENELELEKIRLSEQAQREKYSLSQPSL